jgi:hypothetical protein
MSSLSLDIQRLPNYPGAETIVGSREDPWEYRNPFALRLDQVQSSRSWYTDPQDGFSTNPRKNIDILVQASDRTDDLALLALSCDSLVSKD